MTKAERAEAVAKYRVARAELAVLRAKHKSIGKDFFKDECKRLFDENPQLIDFGWRRYTPYFNDGEPCTFRCCKSDAAVNGQDPWTGEEFDDPEKYPELSDRECDVLATTVNNFLRDFDEDEFEDFFGDHVRITVTKKGVEVTEYSHD